MDDLIIGITDANGLAAEALLKALQQVDIEKESIRLYVSGDAVANRLAYGSNYLVTLDQNKDSFEQCSLVMQLEVDAALSEKIAKEGVILLKQGGNLYFSTDAEECDNNIDFTQRVYDLVDSETYILLKIFQSIHQSNTIESAQVTILQAVSSEGKAGVDELAAQTVELLNARPAVAKIFPVQQAFNLFAKDSSADALNIAKQVQLNLGEETGSIQIQLVQVPVFYGTTFICTLQCQFPLNPLRLKSRFSDIRSVQTLNEMHKVVSPVSSLQDDSLVSISQVLVSDKNVNNTQFVITADNYRHGSAELFLNALLVIRKTFL